MQPRWVQTAERAYTPRSLRNRATERPAGRNGLLGSSDSGSDTRKRFEGEGRTAALGRRNNPNGANKRDVTADQTAAIPRKSRRGMGSGSNRDRFVCAAVVTDFSTYVAQASCRVARP